MTKLLQFTVIFFAAMLISCNGKEDAPTPQLEIAEAQRDLQTAQQATILTVNVTANQDFTVSSTNPLWCLATPDGKTIKITVSENTTPESRTATITVKSKDCADITIKVVQSGSAPLIEVNPKTVAINGDPQEFTITINANILIVITTPSWIERTGVQTDEATQVKVYKFAVTEALTAGERKGTIDITGGTGFETTKASCEVTQTYADKALPRFAVLSDLHIGSSGSEAKVARALQLLTTQRPRVDALFLVGDVTDYGYESQYVTLKSVVDANVPTNIAVYYTTGNHDKYSDPDDTFFTKHLKQNANQYVEINGYPFVIIGMDIKVSPYYNTTTAAFLEEKMAAAATKFPGKPIFVFYHVPVKNTCYGSEDWGSDVLKTTMEKYPQAIAFSGHSHYPIGDERSINQVKFTAVNDGSTTYSELEPRKFSNDPNTGSDIHPWKYNEVTEAIVVSFADANTVKLDRWDTYRNEQIKTPWTITAPFNSTAGYTYNNSREMVCPIPTFKLTDKPVVSEITTNSCKVTFPQAIESNKTSMGVHHYEIQVYKTGATTAEKTLKYFSLFYLNSNMPETLSYKIEGLAVNQAYTIKVQAVASWYTKKSAAIVSDSFTTENYIPDPGVTAPTADAYDVTFTKNGAIDWSPMSFTLTQGSTAPVVSYNSTLKMFMSTYNNSGSQYYKLDYKGNTAFKTKIESAFTFEVFYKTLDNARECSPVSSLESGGLGVEISGSTGLAQLWCRFDGSYKQIGTVKPDVTEYYHMVYTYDGANLKAYSNGNLNETKAQTGPLQFASNEGAHWFAFGGDAAVSGTSVQGPFKGDVVFARMYSRAVTLDETIALYNQIARRQNMTKVADLNTALTVTLPGKTQSTAVQTATTKGWKLMGSLRTTDAEITAFLTEVAAL